MRVCMHVCVCVHACLCVCMHVCMCSQASRSQATLTRFFFAFLSFAESFVVEQQTLFGVDLIHISMISDVKVQYQGRGVGAGLEV